MILLLALIASPFFIVTPWAFLLVPHSSQKSSYSYRQRSDITNYMSSVVDAPTKVIVPKLDFSVTEANLDDFEAIVGLRVTTFYPELCGAGVSNNSMKRRITDTMKRRCGKGSVNFIAQEAGGLFTKNLLGSVEVSPSDFVGTEMEHVGAERKLYLVDLCIKEKFRKMGIATSLLRTIEQYAYNEQFSEVYMHVEVDNVLARNFYAKNGYIGYDSEEATAFTEGWLKRPAEGVALLVKRIVQQPKVSWRSRFRQ